MAVIKNLLHTLRYEKRPAACINLVLALRVLRRAGECGVSVGFEQRGFVGLWQPHLRGQNIAANVTGVYCGLRYKLKQISI